MTNLLSNAIKFSPEGSRVEISITRTHDTATVFVADHGPGIPDQFRETIFDRFSQVDASDKRAKQGTGLGLSICKSIIQGLGGTIAVRATEDRGSTFYFELPLV